jgi:photosystem II stability/assembly factor-like uncharacterized protein
VFPEEFLSMRFRPLALFALLLAGLGSLPTAAEAQQSKRSDKEDSASLPKAWADQLGWRNIGPANMGGRIVGIEVNAQDPTEWWAASASGGLLKTSNNGASFEHQFDSEATVSIGAFDVSESNPDIIWVGTGEENPRNSSSFGDGVYKSTDGGKSWKNMGLRNIFQTGAVLIHPEDPDIVYIGALGRLWGPNEDRGLYKTTDGGKSWEKVLYVDDRTGVIDIVINPDDPQQMLAATYCRMRDGFDGNDPMVKFGEGAGIWRSTDGGDTWQRVTEGLPQTEMGRIGLCYYAKDPNLVYAVIESKKIGQLPDTYPFMGIRGRDADVGARLTEITKDGPAAKAGLKTGDVVLRVDDALVLSYSDLLAEIRRRKAGDTVLVTVARDDEAMDFELELALNPTVAERQEEEQAESEGGEEAAEAESDEGSAEADAESQESEEEAGEEEAGEGEADEEEEPKSLNELLNELRRGSPFAQRLGGQNPNYTDQQGERGADFGGIYRSEDGGETWTRINSLNPRPMYYSKIRVDPSDNNYIWVLGTRLYISRDGGETFTSDGASGEVHVDHHAMWIDPRDGRHVILGNDGGIYVTYDRGEKWDHLNHVTISQFYHVGVDGRRAYNVYGGLQDNGSWGGPSMVRDGSGPVNSDWFRVGGGDGFICLVDPTDPDQLYYESQNGAMRRYNMRTGERGGIRPRAPRGVRYRWNWKTPFILSPHNPEIHFSAGNYVFRSVKKGEDIQVISPEITLTDRGAGSAIGQSPRDENVLYVGTTDGALWATRDGGENWSNLWEVEAKADDAEDNGEGDDEEAETEPEESEQQESEQQESEEASADDPLVGTWSGKFEGDMMPAQRSNFQIALRKNDEGEYIGEYETSQSRGTLSDGQFDASSGSLRLSGSSQNASLTVSATLSEGELTGSFDVNDGAFTIPFTAERVSSATSLEAAEQADEAAAEGKPLAEVLPKPMWVSSIEPSKFVSGRCYVTIDGHRSDVDGPFVLVTENFGETWQRLDKALPKGTGSTRVIREDRRNRDLLYLGTEFGLFISNDRGSSWTKIDSGLPTVAVHEVAQPVAADEIVLGTHGRGVWIANVAALRQWTPEARAQEVVLFEPDEVIRWRSRPRAGASGTRRFVGDNPEDDAVIYYALGRDVREIEMEIRDIRGRVLRRFDVPNDQGLHRVRWNLRRSSGNSRRRGPRVENGTYLVALIVEGETYKETLEIESDPELPTSGAAENEAELLEVLLEVSEEDDE